MYISAEVSTFETKYAVHIHQDKNQKAENCSDNSHLPYKNPVLSSSLRYFLHTNCLVQALISS